MVSKTSNPLPAAFAAALLVPIGAWIASSPDRNLDDLTAYADLVLARPATPIAPLDAMPQVQRHAYASTGRVDPFAAPYAKKKSGGGSAFTVPPLPPRISEALEAFPLDALRMVGTLQHRGERVALVRAPDGIVHRVAPGHYVGLNHGKVVAVEESRVELVELIAVPGVGWDERPAALALSE